MGTRTDELHPDVQRNKPESVGSNDLTGEDLMRYESHRLTTFAKWPTSAKVTATKIAKAGFYYTGKYLEARCKWCNTVLSTWEYGDQVMARHRRAKPDCPFVLNLSNNVPLAPSPQPPSLSVTPQTSRVDQTPSPSADVIDNGIDRIISNESDQSIESRNIESRNIESSEQQMVEQPTASTESEESQEIENGQTDEGVENTEMLSVYFDEERRLRTFRSWPLSFIDPVELAKCGFIYSGINDCVRCVFCLGYVGSWEQSDRPEAVHRDLFSDCPFVRGLPCGDKPMTTELREQIISELTSPNFSDALADPMGIRAGPSSEASDPYFDVPYYFTGANHISDQIGGYDEAGIRPRTQDLNSGPEKGSSVLTLKDPHLREEKVEEMIGVIRHSGPAHPKYATLEGRLRTFREWPPALKQQPRELAEAGFYYIGLSDQVKCFYCDGGLRNWQPEDDPWVEHSRWFSKCGFIRLVKGDEFIAQCIVTKPPEAEMNVASSHDRSKITEEALQAMMISREVQEALSCGIDPSRIKMALKQKWEETGSGFTGSQHLIEAACRAQHEQEERVSVENNQTQTPFAVNISSFNVTVSSEPPVSSTSQCQTSPRLEVTAPPEQQASAKLPSPSIPDKSDQSEAKGEKESSPPAAAIAQDLERENRRLKEERTCKICMDNEIGVVFLPCGHLICCYQCAPALTNCPLCRQPIHGTVKTYMS